MTPPDSQRGREVGAAHVAPLPGIVSTLDPVEAVARAELAAGSVFTTRALSDGRDAPRVTTLATSGEAVRAAVAEAASGRRASVVLATRELLGALDAIRGAAAARAPITVHVAGPSATSSRDELAPALDVGAGVLVSSTAQDAVDLALVLRRAAEDSETPFIHFVDLTASGPVTVLLPSADLAQTFLGPERDRRAGRSVGGSEVERKRAERSFATRVPFALGSAMRELGELTGRLLAPIERFETTDAEEIIVAVGCVHPVACAVARAARAEGKRVGVLGLRSLRPFFGAETVKAVARAKAIVVLEPLDVALAPCGPAAACIKAAFADALTWAPGFPGVGRIPPIVSIAFATMDGGTGEPEVKAALAEIGVGDRARRLVVFGTDG